MNIQRKLLIALLVGCIVAVTSACTLARHQESVGEYIDGSAITATINAKLAEDPTTSALSIKVKTIDASTVQLSGFVKSQAEKNRAGEIARSLSGVRTVHNDLIVKP